MGLETTIATLEQTAMQHDLPPDRRIDALLELSQRIRQNEVLRAVEYDNLAKELAIETHDNERWALALRSLSDDYMLLGDNVQALGCLQECLVLVEPMEDFDKLAAIHLNVGAIYSRMESKAKAKLFYEKAAANFEKANNELGMAKCMANSGLLLMEEGQLDEAEELFNRSIDISKKLGVRIGQAINNSNLGNLTTRKRDWQLAYDYYQKALDIYTEIENNSGVASSLINLGNTKAEMGEMDEALPYLHQALALTQSMGTRYYEIAAHKNLFEVYEKTGQWQEAFRHLKQYHHLKEEVLGNEAKQKAAEIEMQGQLVIKEKEVEIEKLRNIELKQAYEELRTAQEALLEEERMAIHGRLASELAHEVQNPLQFVNNFAPINIDLLEELQDALANDDGQEVATILHDLANNCRSIEEHGKRVASIVMKLQLKG